MRAPTCALVSVLFAGSSAIAAAPMAPSNIQAAFFNGQPFTASTPGGTQFKMIFTPDRKMTREPLGKSGYKGSGTWKLDATGFCTSWARAKATCFTVIPSGENKWLVQKRATTIATTIGEEDGAFECKPVLALTRELLDDGPAPGLLPQPFKHESRPDAPHISADCSPVVERVDHHCLCGEARARSKKPLLARYVPGELIPLPSSGSIPELPHVAEVR